MAKKKIDPATLTPEEYAQKKKSRVRVLLLVIVLDVLMAIYLIYEIFTLFSK